MNVFKLTKKTKSIVENFSRFNPAMLFREGEFIRTVSTDKDVFGVAKVDQVIPNKFGIGDLPKFLNLIKLYEDPDLSINDDKTITFVGPNERKFVYTLTAEKTILTLPEKDIPVGNVIAQFKLPAIDLISIKKNFAAGGLTEVVFLADGKNLFVKGLVASDPTSHQYSAKVGEIDNTFKLVFVDRKINNLLEYDYQVTVYPKIVKLVSGDSSLVYYLSPELTSTYE